MDTSKVKNLAKDLSKSFPRSPRETLAGYVIAGRTLDKCRATLAGIAGDFSVHISKRRWASESFLRKCPGLLADVLTRPDLAGIGFIEVFSSLPDGFGNIGVISSL